MNYVQLVGSIGIPVLIVLILYVMYLVFSYLARHANGEYPAANKIKRRIKWAVSVAAVVMIAVLTPTFIWPR